MSRSFSPAFPVGLLPHRARLAAAGLLLTTAFLAASCGDGESEPAQVEVPLAFAAAVMDRPTDLGWTIELDEVQFVSEDILLKTVEAEEQLAASSARKAPAHPIKRAVLAGLGWILPSAHAHPGHGEGGVIVGELLGRRVLQWSASSGETGSEVGTATSVQARVDAIDFGLGVASTEDGLSADDPLVGHAARLVGRARKDDAVVEFEALLDVEPESKMQGALLSPGPVELGEGSDPALTLRFQGAAVFGDAHFFDETDFSLLWAEAQSENPETDRVMVRSGSGRETQTTAAHNRWRRKLTSHDHHDVLVR